MARPTHASLAQPALARAETRTAAVWPALLAALLGLFILYGTGFAQPDLLHNAAHDARHAFAFPCH
jgi:cobalt transporter subunit CbtB